MKTVNDFFYSYNKKDKIHYIECIPENICCKAIVQIVHGMAEHADRYLDFADFLCSQGYIVFIHEHVGHGKTAMMVEKLGVFSDSHQNETMLEDTLKMNITAKKKYPHLKVFLLGHSMGSFIVRNFAAKYGNHLDGLIISGTGGRNKMLGVGILVAKVIKLFNGGNYKSKMIDNLSFGNFNWKYEDVKTKFDWLSRDREIVNKYIEDDFCGYLFDLNGMLSLFNLNRVANSDNTYMKTDNELKILIISGAMDPVGNFGKGVKEVHDNYKKFGSTNSVIKLYNSSRHELLNEYNKESVYEDIVNFMNI